MAIFEQHLQAIVTLLSLVNPLICRGMFAEIEAGVPRAARMADATKVALTVLIVLVAAALAGAKVLKIFGISIDAFSIAGGAVLTWIGFSMLHGESQGSKNSAKSGAGEKRSLTPIVLFAASPGTITGVITLAVAHSMLLPVTALVASAVATLVMWIVMMLPLGSEGPGNGGMLRDTMTRFMGLIVVAMGVQFVLTAVQDFFFKHS